MAVPVQSKSLPQPAKTENMPHNSLGLLPSASDARAVPPQPANVQQANTQQANAQRQIVAVQSNNSKLAFELYHPLNKQAGIAAPVLGGLATIGASAGAISYYKKKRRERLNKERDNLWKQDARNIIQRRLNDGRDDGR